MLMTTSEDQAKVDTDSARDDRARQAGGNATQTRIECKDFLG
jgi:hypothetical protein